MAYTLNHTAEAIDHKLSLIAENKNLLPYPYKTELPADLTDVGDGSILTSNRNGTEQSLHLANFLLPAGKKYIISLSITNILEETVTSTPGFSLKAVIDNKTTVVTDNTTGYAELDLSDTTKEKNTILVYLDIPGSFEADLLIKPQIEIQPINEDGTPSNKPTAWVPNMDQISTYVDRRFNSTNTKLKVLTELINSLSGTLGLPDCTGYPDGSILVVKNGIWVITEKLTEDSTGDDSAGEDSSGGDSTGPPDELETTLATPEISIDDNYNLKITNIKNAKKYTVNLYYTEELSPLIVAGSVENDDSEDHTTVNMVNFVRSDDTGLGWNWDTSYYVTVVATAEGYTSSAESTGVQLKHDCTLVELDDMNTTELAYDFNNHEIGTSVYLVDATTLTNEDDGYSVETKCSCGCSKTFKVKAAKQTEIIAASCEADGLVYTELTNDNIEFKYPFICFSSIPATGHSYSDWGNAYFDKNDTTHTFRKKQRCKYCGSIKTITIYTAPHEDSDGDGICDDCDYPMESN